MKRSELNQTIECLIKAGEITLANKLQVIAKGKKNRVIDTIIRSHAVAIRDEIEKKGYRVSAGDIEDAILAIFIRTAEKL